jgi:hypothetical protein
MHETSRAKRDNVNCPEMRRSIGPAGAASPGAPKAPTNKSNEKPKPKEDCHPLGKAIAEGVLQVGAGTSDKGSAILAAGLLAKNPGLIVVGEASALLGTGLQAAGAAGRLLATGNVDRARFDAIGVAFSFFQSQSRAGALALGYTATTAVDLNNQLSPPGQDCKR